LGRDWVAYGYFVDQRSEVCYDCSSDGHLLIEIRTHSNSIWRYRLSGSVHRPQARYNNKRERNWNING